MTPYNEAVILDSVGILYFLGVMLPDVSRVTRSTGIVLALIVLALSGFSMAGLVPADPDVFPPNPILIMNGFLIVMIVSLFVPATRRLWDSIPTHRIVLWHIMRLPAGLAFVVLAYDGKLPSEFGYSAGFGDTLAGALSIAYVMLPALRNKRGVAVWNVVGFLDFIPALGTAAMTLNASPIRIFANGDLMRAVGDFPAELIPTYVAPILLFTHILVFKRKFAETGSAGSAEPLTQQLA